MTKKKTTKSVRSEAAVKANATRKARKERLSEIARKSWRTRRANAAKASR